MVAGAALETAAYAEADERGRVPVPVEIMAAAERCLANVAVGNTQLAASATILGRDDDRDDGGGPSVSGAALWAPPGEWKTPVGRQIALLPALATVFGRQLPPLLSGYAQIDARHARSLTGIWECSGHTRTVKDTGSARASSMP